jgi:hypothetical protein
MRHSPDAGAGTCQSSHGTRTAPVRSRGGLASGLSGFELWLAAEQARELPGLAWSVCQLEQAVAFCLEQEGFLSGFQVVESQFHSVHFAPLSLLERAPLIGSARS